MAGDEERLLERYQRKSVVSSRECVRPFTSSELKCCYFDLKIIPLNLIHFLIKIEKTTTQRSI